MIPSIVLYQENEIFHTTLLSYFLLSIIQEDCSFREGSVMFRVSREKNPPCPSFGWSITSVGPFEL